MIPKLIHACWLGKGEMPQEQKEYVEGWKRLNPEFEVRLWTDETFDRYLDDSLFVKECIKTACKLLKKFNGILNNSYYLGRALYSSG